MVRDTPVTVSKQVRIRNNVARAYNRRCNIKAISITYSERVSVAFGIQHAMRMRHIIMGTARFCDIISHYLLNGMTSGAKVSEHKTCILIFCTFV